MQPACSVAAAAAGGGGGGGPAPAAPAPAAAGEEKGWDADTATDSDDEQQQRGFMAAYGAALDAQLAGTAMAESFERAPVPAGAPSAPAAGAGQQQGTAGGGEGGDVEGEEGAGAALRPVDVDLNLVSSLLASYGEQAGLPGPAGTLAGLMGLKLPDPDR